MEQEKSEWQRDFDNSDEFIQKLALDYPDVQWGEGSMEISSCPKGWEKIIENLFGAINVYHKTKIYYLEKTRIARLKMWWNNKTWVMGRLVSKMLKPYDRMFPDTDGNPRMIFPEMREKVEATIWWKAENRIKKILGKMRFDMSRYQRLKYPEPVKIQQVKQKFTLRIYTSGGDDIIDGMIRLAEYQASRTCEETGSRGYLCVRGGWYRTLSKAKMKELGYSSIIHGKTW